jgi:hypothetical protein
MSLNPAVTSRYNLGPVKPWVESAAYLVGNKFNVKTIYGWRAQDPFPDHPSGHALDYMITSQAQGQAIADYLQQNASALGVKYIIWNRQVWEADGKPVAGWHAYTSTSNPHTDHVHVTFNDQPGTGAVSDTATLASATVDNTCAWSLKTSVSNSCILSKVQVRSLLGVGIIGVSVGIGLVAVVVAVALGMGKNIPGASVVRSLV